MRARRTTFAPFLACSLVARVVAAQPVPPSVATRSTALATQTVVPEVRTVPPAGQTVAPEVRTVVPEVRPPSPEVRPPSPAVQTVSAGDSSSGFTFPFGAFTLRLLPYVQAQYENHQESEGQLSADGRRLLNQDRFALRRGRLVVGLDHRWTQLLLELDVNTVQGVAVGVRQAEATLRLPPDSDGRSPAALTLGMLRTPFGHEVLRSARDRVFAENATVSQAFFPGESDLGARAQGAIGWFRYAVAVVNGHPIDEPRFGAQAPIAPRDFVGRVGVDLRRTDLRITAGLSALGGSGFHPGTPQGVDGLGVRDANESGVLTPDDLVLIQGRAAVRSQTFARFAAGVDASIEARLGSRARLSAYAEAMFGQNMDRGLFISDPVAYGFDLRGLGVIAGASATLFDRAIVGARFDWYNPNVDSTASQAGRVVVAPRDLWTLSLLAGVALPGAATRLIAQYDLVRDHLALGVDGLPTDLANNRFTLRVQVSP